jgi:hypothetical protein
MKSWFNVSYVKLIISSQLRTPKCPLCRVRVKKQKLLSPFMNTESNEEAETTILNANKRIESLERHVKQLRLVVNATFIYSTDMKETTL